MIVKTVGPEKADIMLVGEAPGETENRLGVPFVGPAGKTLDLLLRQAGIIRAQCVVTNVAREQPPGNNIGFYFEDKKQTQPKPILSQWLSMLAEDIQRVKPNIVIGLGATAQWALTGIKGIAANRGYIAESSLVPGQKVLTTYHPQAVNYEWKLGFQAVLDLKKAVRESHRPDMPEDTRELIRDPSVDAYVDYCRFLCESEEVKYAGIDLETSSPGAHINRIGLGHNQNYAMSIPILRGPNHFWNTADEARIWQATFNVLQNVPMIAQNGTYDYAVLCWHFGIFPKEIYFDTHIAGHVCWPEAPRSLAFLTSVCCNVPAWKGTSKDDPAGYNAGDVANMLGCVPVLERELRLLKQEEVFKRELAQIKPAVKLQLQGMLYDKERQDKLYEEYQDVMVEIQTTVNKVAGKTVKLSSSPQLQKLLYIDLGLPAQYKRRKSASEQAKVTVDAEAIKKLVRKFPDNKLLSLIAVYKKYHKLCTSFLQVQPSPAGRVHTCYNITGANMLHERDGRVLDDEDSYRSFGRWSSSASIILPYGPGNLQNVPKKARKLFLPGEGKIIVSGDYKQAEAVVVSYLINDMLMKKMFKASFGQSRQACKENHWDVHRITASQLFGKPAEEITDEERNTGKRLRHAISYSAGPQVLAVNLGISVQEAKQLLKRYHSVIPQLGLWQQSIQRELQMTRTLTNLLGRRHTFLERWGDELFRSAYSFIPQSTVGDLMNLGLVRFDSKYAEEYDLCLQLHDAIYVICDIGQEEEVMERMKECMLIPLVYKGEEFTIDVDFSIGKTWGDMEEI